MPRPHVILAALLTLLCACAAPGKAGTTPTTTRTTPAVSPPARSAQPTAAPRTTTRTAPTLPTRDPTSGLRYVRVRDLPREASPVLTLIADGGPFRSTRDGVTFANREGILPPHPRGTYREYTVPTPGSRDRGARRIVCAGPARTTTECYYTADHYATFRRIQP